MADVVKRTDPKEFKLSANTPEYPAAVWIRNPPSLRDLISRGVPPSHWKLNNADPAAATDVVEMTGAEKVAVNAAERAAERAERRAAVAAEADGDDGDGVRLRALLEFLNKRDKLIVARIQELQGALSGIKASSSGSQLRAAIPNSWLPTMERGKAAVIDAFKAEVNSGDHDTKD